MHIHVGSNMPGYLPQSDVLCFEDIESALDALKSELKEQQDYYYERCEAESPEQQEKGSECCEWCDVANDVEAAMGRISDGDAAHHSRNGHGTLHVFRPETGPDMVHWLMFADGDRDTCDSNPDSPTYLAA